MFVFMIHGRSDYWVGIPERNCLVCVCVSLCLCLCGLGNASVNIHKHQDSDVDHLCHQGLLVWAPLNFATGYVHWIVLTRCPYQKCSIFGQKTSFWNSCIHVCVGVCVCVSVYVGVCVGICLLDFSSKEPPPPTLSKKTQSTQI